jgi:DNA-binding transcriptional ArsR family regulator
VNSVAREILKKNPTKSTQEFKIIVWLIIAGSKATHNRIKIISLLREKPLNTNQISGLLQLDYKVVERHLDILVRNKMLERIGRKYGILYFPSSTLNENLHIYDELIAKIELGKKSKN